MAGNTFGTVFTVTTFGESHGKAVGVVLDGVLPKVELSEKDIQKELDRRRPGQSAVTTPRREEDRVEILSGIFEGKTTGTPLCLMVRNRDARSKAYEQLRELFRPGHGDYSYEKKYGIRDYRGGGRASGRETLARVAAGAVAKKILSRRGVSIQAYTIKAAGIECSRVDTAAVERNVMRACDPEAAKKMEAAVLALSAQGESAGGIVECRITGAAAGIGEPVFSKLDAELAKAMLSIGAVRGIEFGVGFAAADMKGSEFNDEMDGEGFLSNNAGGILGGISTGEEIVFRLPVKPTPSVRTKQRTRTTKNVPAEISIEGRHDPCICPRIVPVVEAMAALVLEDMYRLKESMR